MIVGREAFFDYLVNLRCLYFSLYNLFSPYVCCLLYAVVVVWVVVVCVFMPVCSILGT